MPAIEPPTQSAARVMSARKCHQPGRSGHRRTESSAMATLLLAISVVTCLLSVSRPASAQTADTATDSSADTTLSEADQKATELARAAHKQAAAINGLPRFY